MVKSKKLNQRLPPGPRGLPILGSATLSGSGIVISSPSLAKEVLKDQDTTFADRDVPVAGRAITLMVVKILH
ncbi:hypothetical protein MKW92_037617, partial [Papaver armeniacum]